MRDRTALRGRARRELEVRAVCEAEEDQLLAAKDAAAEDPTPENLAAKRAAMASYEETRSWLRAIAQLGRAERNAVQYANATDPKGMAKLRAARADLERIPRLFGPLIASMKELAGATASASPDEELPPGSVDVTPQVAEVRASFGKGGA